MSHVISGCSLSCPTFGEPSGSILLLVASFFGGSLTWVGVWLSSSGRSFKYHVSMSLFMCESKGMHLVISSSYHTNISFGPLSYNIMYPSWLATSYNCSPSTMSMWSYHWRSKYPFHSLPLWEWTYSSPRYTSKYCCNYWFWKAKHMFKGRSPTFSLTTPNNKWILLLPKMIFILWWTLSLLTQLAQIWCNEHRWKQHMQQQWLLKRKHHPMPIEHQTMTSFPLLLRCMGVFILVLIHSWSLVHRSLLCVINSFL